MIPGNFLPLFVARRYFRSEKKAHVIQLITRISMVGIGIGSAALIIVLSVFNGFENLVLSLYNSFDPHIKIVPVSGKSFPAASLNLQDIQRISGVRDVCPVLEDNALLRSGDKQYICTVKGVGPSFATMTGIESKMVDGIFHLGDEKNNYGVAGQGVAYFLSVQPGNLSKPVFAYAPRRDFSQGIEAAEAFITKPIQLAGIFSIQQDFDAGYLLVPLSFAMELFSRQGEWSALEISLTDGANESAIKNTLSSMVGSTFIVKTRIEQHAFLYKILRTEKWAVYLILTFILIIAAFNIISSLTMMMLDKRKDLAILSAMGLNRAGLRKIFIWEGMMVASTGGFMGLGLGFILCLIQEKFGLVKLEGSGSFVVDAYPVSMHGGDFLLVFGTVLIIGLLSAIVPSGRVGFTLGRKN